MKQIILASSSPRRKELLKQIGLDFLVVPSDCDETMISGSPAEMVMALSARKCEDVVSKQSSNECDMVVIGADTIVVFDGNILGKPKNDNDAYNMLRSLSGKTHSVFTGVTIIDKKSGKCNTFCEETEVTFYDLTDKEITDYINTGEPLDKAGAYGIQGLGAILVNRINGDYFNVVGLPIARLKRVLQEEFDI